MPWTLGVGYEFERRADGLAALKSIYGIQIKGSLKTMDLGLLYQAIAQGQVDMIAASATDGDAFRKWTCRFWRTTGTPFRPMRFRLWPGRSA